MRDTYLCSPSNGGCGRATSSYRRAGAIARRSAILLSGTAAIALTVAQPASAIVINDPVAAAVGGIENYYDRGNQFPYVVSLFGAGPETGSSCTGSLINSRTILTAAHCFLPNRFGIPTISFDPIASPGGSIITSFVRHPGFLPGDAPSIDNDIAVISLAQPIPATTVAPVKLLMLQPGQPGFPTVGTTITMVGYGLQGTGSLAGVWKPSPGTNNPPPEGLPIFDGKRRVADSSLGAYAAMNAIYENNVNQYFFFSQFRNPLSPNNPNRFNLSNLPPPLEGGTAGGDSGGPLFAMINGQPVQIGVVRGGEPVSIPYCEGPGGAEAPPVPCDQTHQIRTGVLESNGYGEISDWTPINLFLQWINENNPLRQVTAAAGNFNWSNPAAWIDAFTDPANPNGAVPNNTRGVVDIPDNQAARYYDVTLSNPGTITLDMSPQIDNLSIIGPQSELVIGGSYTLTVLLDTRLSAGILTMLPGGMLATGAYTQTGGLLQFQLAPSGSGKITVANTATLGGALGVAVAPGLYGLSTQYTLLTAGAISGRFAQFLSTPPSAFLSLSGPVYTATSVGVTLTRTPFGVVPGLNANQRAVGNALEGAYNTALTGPAKQLYSTLLMTGTPNALSQLSGEGIAAAQNTAFASGSMFNEMLMDQGAFWRNGETADSNGVTFRAEPLAYAAEKKKPGSSAFKALKEPPPPAYQPRTWRVWTGGFGGVQSFNGDAVVGSANAATSVAGGAMGFDYQVDATGLIGFAVGGSEAHFSVPDRATSGDVVGGHIGAYGVANWGALYAAGVVSYSRLDNRTTRTIAGVGATETATGNFGSDLVGARLEIGRTYGLPGFNLTPFAAVQTSTLWQHDFTESTSAAGLPGILGLSYQSQTTTSLPTFLGLQFDTRLTLYNMVWSPFVRTAWVHEFNPDRSITGSLVSVPGALFAVDGARAWSDALKVNAGARVALNQYASLFASFDGEFADSGHSYAGRGGIRFGW